jgi:hypothetical protein
MRRADAQASQPTIPRHQQARQARIDKITGRSSAQSTDDQAAG